MFFKYIFNLNKIGVCPFGEAFVDSPLGDLNKDGNIDNSSVLNEWRTEVGLPENLYGYATQYRLHRYAECSNAGLCNREEGICECFPGFEGSACQRHSCPSANSEICSGNGICLPSTILVEMNNKPKSWEYDKFPVCKCDNGWSGIDCSRRDCPKGFDPVHQRLEYTITFGLFGESDGRSEKYTTPPYHFNIIYDHMKYETITLIPRDISRCYPVAGALDPGFLAEISEEIKRAIHVVPDFTQTTVSAVCGAFNRVKGEKLDKEPTPSTGGKETKGIIVTIKLKYTDYERFYKNGFQFTVHSEKPLKDDHQLDEDVTELKDKNIDLTTLISNSSAERKDSDGKEVTDDENIVANYLDECSKRGICDTQTGLCKCFDGYAGSACENQRSIAL